MPPFSPHQIFERLCAGSAAANLIDELAAALSSSSCACSSSSSSSSDAWGGHLHDATSLYLRVLVPLRYSLLATERSAQLPPALRQRHAALFMLSAAANVGEESVLTELLASTPELKSADFGWLKDLSEQPAEGTTTTTGAWCLSTLLGSDGPVRAAAFSIDGATCFTGGRDTQLRVFDAPLGRQRDVAIRSGHNHPITALTVSEDGMTLATCDEGGILLVWAIASLSSATTAATAAGYPAAPPTPPSAAAARRDPVSWAPEATLHGHTGPINSCVFSEDGSCLATTALDDESARIWRCRRSLPRSSSLSSSSFSSSSSSKWELDLTLTPPPPPNRGRLLGCAITPPDGQLFLATYGDDGVCLWSGKNGDLKHHLAEGTCVLSAAFGRNGCRLATCGTSRAASVWSNLTCSTPPLQTMLRGGHSDTVTSVDMSRRDGRNLITSSRDGTVRLWHEQVANVKICVHPEPVDACCYSRGDEQTIIAHTSGHRVFLWDAYCQNIGGQVQIVTSPRVIVDNGHNGVVEGCCLSVDASLALTFSRDGTAVVWATRPELGELRNSPQITDTIMAAAIPTTAVASSSLHVATAAPRPRPRAIGRDRSVAEVLTDGKPVACVSVSSDGQMMCVGQPSRPPAVFAFRRVRHGRGLDHDPRDDYAWAFQCHLFCERLEVVKDRGVGCVAAQFSNDGNVVVTSCATVGGQTDLHVLWSSRDGRPISVLRAVSGPAAAGPPPVLFLLPVQAAEADCVEEALGRGRRWRIAAADKRHVRFWDVDEDGCTDQGIPIAFDTAGDSVRADAVRRVFLVDESRQPSSFAPNAKKSPTRARGAQREEAARKKESIASALGRFAMITVSSDHKLALAHAQQQLGDNATRFAAVVWEIPFGRRRSWLRGHFGAISMAAFSSDNRRVATLSKTDRTVRVWETHNGFALAAFAFGMVPLGCRRPTCIGYWQSCWNTRDVVLVGCNDGTLRHLHVDSKGDQKVDAELAAAEEAKRRADEERERKVQEEAELAALEADRYRLYQFITDVGLPRLADILRTRYDAGQGGPANVAEMLGAVKTSADLEELFASLSADDSDGDKTRQADDDGDEGIASNSVKPQRKVGAATHRLFTRDEGEQLVAALDNTRLLQFLSDMSAAGVSKRWAE